MKRFNLTQKYFYAAAVGLLAATLPARAQVAPQNTSIITPMPAPNLGPNLLQNAGFENGDTDWKIPEDTAQVVDDLARSGKHSLHYTNTDKTRYRLFTQEIDAKPGQQFAFSAWIKGKNIKGKNAVEGASICIESYAGDSEGQKYIGGTHPGGFTGTFNWKQISGEYVIPEKANKTYFYLYLRKEAVGEVWFDDMQLQEITAPTFMPFLQRPNYRGLVKAGDDTPWQSLVQINKQDNWKSGQVTITNSLSDSAGKVLLTQTERVAFDSKNAKITLNPPHDLPAGNYVLKQTFTDPEGKTTEYKQTIRVVQEMPKTYIDADGFTVVDGKRFFPMGVYAGSPLDDENLGRFAAGGMNTIISYGYGLWGGRDEYLTLAQKHHLKVIYTINTLYPGYRQYGDNAYDVAAEIIKNVRDNPTLLAWYTNDEMEGTWLPSLYKMYGQIQELDPSHPTFQVLNSQIYNHKSLLERYFYTTDAVSADVYPVGMGSENLSTTSTDARIVKASAQNAKGFWMVPQIMDWAVYRKNIESHQPSLDEMRNQAYQSLINGATGLIWYQESDLKYKGFPRNKENIDEELHAKRWADVSAMAHEINKITPVILENRKVLLDVPANAEVEAAAWQDGDELLILLANPYYAEKSVTIPLPKGWRIKDVNQGEIKSTFADGKATFTLPSVGSGVFYLMKK